MCKSAANYNKGSSQLDVLKNSAVAIMRHSNMAATVGLQRAAKYLPSIRILLPVVKAQAPVVIIRRPGIIGKNISLTYPFKRCLAPL
jgi:hypothetical protein